MFTETSHGEAACPPYTAQPGTSRERACAFGETRGHGTGVATGMLRERAGVFSLRGTAGQRPRKPAAPGAAWSSSKACHAELRHLSRHSPSPRPDGHFPSVAERDTAGAFPGAFPGASSGASPGLFRGLSRGAFPGAWRAEMRRLSQTRPVIARTDFLRLYTANPPHRARRGLCRRLGAKKRSLSPTQPVTAPGQTFSVCHRKPAARHVPREGWCSSSPSALPRRRARQILNTQEVSP